MDEVDVKILMLLRQDGRESLGNIAAKLGVSKATVSRRVSRLEHEGVISGYTLTTNSAQLGLMKAILGIEVTGQSLNPVIDELRQFREIQYIYKVFGDHGLICEVYVKSVDSLYELIQTKILKVPSIENVEVDILIERIDLNPDAELEMLTVRH
jgi:DNA-binding Lrp family transcriptional regulator